MRQVRRGAAGIILLAVLGTATACGAEKRTALPGPDATAAPSAPTNTAVIPPTPYEGGFVAVAKATEAAPAFAQRLADDVVAGGKVRGDTDSPAADLRAKLTHRLTLHVHLFGLVAAGVLDSGPDSRRTKAALAAVDLNGRALAKLIPAGDAKAEPSAKPGDAGDEDAVSNVARKSPDFLTAWRTHVDDLAAYALAAREGIDPDKDDARRDLDTWRAAAASNLKNVAEGQVRSTTLRGQLGRYTKALTNGMTALAEQDGTAPERFRNAAQAMAEVAESLGNGLARAADLDGDARDSASDIRSDFTRLLTENVAMTGAFVLASYTDKKAGPAGKEAGIARFGLDENSKAFAERLRPAADPVAQVQFLQLWRTAVNDFLDYAEAVRTGSQSRADAEVKSLNGQRKKLGSFLAGVGKGKDATQLSAALRTHIANLTGAIQALKTELAPPA